MFLYTLIYLNNTKNNFLGSYKIWGDLQNTPTLGRKLHLSEGSLTRPNQ